MTIQEQAAEALGRAGDRLARAEAAVRAAITDLNRAIDLAHSAGTDPEAVHGLVTAHANPGVLGEGYLAEEIRAWHAIYDPGRPQPAGPDELRDLHPRPRPLASPGTVPTRQAAAGALTSAGVQLAQAEAAFEGAFGQLADAADFALNAGIPRGAVHGLVTARARPGAIGSEYLAEEIRLWDTAVDALAEMKADSRIPTAFWELDLLAHAAKGTGRYPAAAAIWQVASGLLPAGHEMREDLARMITNLRLPAQPGQSVNWDGHLFTSRAAVIPAHQAVAADTRTRELAPGPAGAPALIDAVREHAARHDNETGWKVITECWDDGDISSTISGAADLGEAIAALIPFIDACASPGLASRGFPAPPVAVKPVPGTADGSTAVAGARSQTAARTGQNRRMS